MGEEDQARLQLDGYHSFFVSVGPGKGLVTFAKPSFEHVCSVKTSNFQMIKFSSGDLDSIHVYRSAEGSLREMRDRLEELVSPGRSVLISGDVNICLDKEPNNLISGFLRDQGFVQLGKEATHDQGGRIDHIYFKGVPGIEADVELNHHHPYYSDHDALCFTLKDRPQVLRSRLVNESFMLFLGLRLHLHLRFAKKTFGVRSSKRANNSVYFPKYLIQLTQ